MSLIFEHYWPLLLLGLIPLLVLIQRKSAVDLSPRHLQALPADSMQSHCSSCSGPDAAHAVAIIRAAWRLFISWTSPRA